MTRTLASSTPGAAVTGPVSKDIPRRPSPWHEIAHSLSTTSSPAPHGHSFSRSRRDSSSSSIHLSTPPDSTSLPFDSAVLSTSQALREWEIRLSHPESDAIRHHLKLAQPHPQAPTRKTSTPKLAAERDKAGYIEYKLKLIDPTAERFERLVTQMMWRLKQGRNEAIYELGLADDGTVIGLTRAEMDASLRTLELMASEVGATVLVLKEIVLSRPLLTSTSPSSAICSSVYNGLGKDDGKWTGRPDLDDSGLPRKGNKGRDGQVSNEGLRSRRRRNKRLYSLDQKGNTGEVDEVAGVSHDGQRGGESLGFATSAPASSGSDDEDLQFAMDDEATLEPRPKAKPARTKAGPPRMTSKKEEKKRRKSAVKQEHRRLDLLRGDGTNPFWREIEMAKASNASGHVSEASLNGDALSLPHRPARPSSLRLATPVSSPEHTFLDDLLHVPLDSLSLSFADVQTITESTPSPSPSSSSSLATSPSTRTEHASHYLVGDEDVVGEHAPCREARTQTPPHLEAEMICVEALVVRKLQHDHLPSALTPSGGNGEGGGEDDDDDGEEGEEEEWIFGGEEDAWGFGGEDE